MIHNNENTHMHAKRIQWLPVRLGWLMLLASLTLAGCGGGASTTPQAVTNTSSSGGGGDTYAGPAPQTQDAQNFKTQVYDNLRGADRCGNCHTPGGNAAGFGFANRGDVNEAYTSALGYVDRTTPANSRIVQKFRTGSHFCWLGQTEQSACAALLETWLTNWLAPAGGGTTTIILTPNTGGNVGTGASFPTTAPGSYTQLHGLLTQFCSNCHVPNVAQSQQPFFAVADVQSSYTAATSKISLTTPNQSRLYLRLVQDSHNCWNLSDDAIAGPNCNTGASGAVGTIATPGTPSSGSKMLAAIQAVVDSLTASQVPVAQTTITSRAVNLLTDGITASAGNRNNANVIALYEFKSGSGVTVVDTSGAGVTQSNLTLSGTAGTDYEWLSSWGVRFLTANGKAVSTPAASRKIYDMITATGEYSIEAWVAPSNIAQQNAFIVSYSSNATNRNFTLGQNVESYRFYNRTANTAVTNNGEPFLQTDPNAKDLKASLQHVVVTYSNSAARRRIYVDGVYTGDVDGTAQGALSTWNNSYALIFGNEHSNNRPWLGTLRMVAIHNKALSGTEIQQNFDAGVGQKYFLLFNISNDGAGNPVAGVPTQSYIKFEVAQYDNFSYLFNKPTYVNLSGQDPSNLRIGEIRVGINGQEADVGQVFAKVSATINAPAYTTANGQELSALGGVLPLSRGPSQDMFFLSFKRLGSGPDSNKDYFPLASTASIIKTPTAASDVMVRNFEEINATLAALTSVPRTTASIGGTSGTYTTVYQQLPPIESINGFLSSHQMAVTQLAIQYCNVLADDTNLRTAYFNNGVANSLVNFGGMTLSSASDSAFTNRDRIITPLLDRVLNVSATATNLTSQPDPTAVRNELRTMIGLLADTTSCPGGSCPAARTTAIVKATCAAALAGAPMLLQ